MVEIVESTKNKYFNEVIINEVEVMCLLKKYF